MSTERRTVEVWADWESLRGASKIGVLTAIPSRGKEVFAFEYERAWFEAKHSRVLDPTLQLFAGAQYAPADKPNFGVFLDSSPDRWGRVLMQRREAQLARDAKRKQRVLTELDYLLGVYDGHRLGALRYRVGGGPFLDNNAELASPPWTSLRELEQASRRLEQPNAERDPKYSAWLRLLLAPGRSLGGARPKASVLDPNGRLWLAKFPSERDVEDIGGWETVVHALAKRASVETAEYRCAKFGSRHHTFLARRFDRTPSGARLHFASAMTMLNRADGAEGASYLDLAQLLIQNGSEPNRDLEQLWRRIAFYVCVSNVDDHLRNHGFLLQDHGWALAPAYDINPVAAGGGLTLNISETDNAQDLDLVREVAPFFRVKAKRATEIIDEVVTAVRGWRIEAKRVRISRSEQDSMADAFRLSDG
jgi:serine/threonine-protein kinase HipA